MRLPIKLRYIIKNIRMLFRVYGIKFPIIILQRIAEYSYCLLFREKTFTFLEKEYRYFFHLENPTFRVERCVEIPIVMEEVKKMPQGSAILEVGNTLQNYTNFPHDIVDKYEKDKYVSNEDIVDYSPGKKYDLIISISTLEHVGWDETPREPEKVTKAIAHLKSLVKPNGKMIVTVPTGYNDALDKIIRDGHTGFDDVFFLKRISKDNRWKQTNYEDIKDIKYGQTYICANALAVGIYSNSEHP